MKLEVIQQEWANDAHIDDKELDREALRIPILHSKYYDILMAERRQLHALMENKRALEWILTNLFKRTLTQEELEFFDLEMSPKKILGPDVANAVANNEHMVKLKLRIALQEDKIEFIRSVIQAINSRSFQIRGAIEWKKFASEGR